MILCWGDVGWDDYEGEDAPRPGGCALNVARSLALAGAEVEVAGPIGEDGRPLIDLLVGWGVGVRGVEVLGAPTPRQRIRLRDGHERQLCGHQGGALLGYTPGETTRRLLANADLVTVPVWRTTLPWLDRLWGSREGPVALDLMDLEDLDAETAEELIARAWIAFAGLEEGHPALTLLRDAARRTGRLVVVTLGDRGGVVQSGDLAVSWAAAPLQRALVDTTGCGDAFAGTFLARLCGRWGQRSLPAALLREALDAASSRAAEVACHHGAVEVSRS